MKFEGIVEYWLNSSILIFICQKNISYQLAAKKKQSS